MIQEEGRGSAVMIATPGSRGGIHALTTSEREDACCSAILLQDEAAPIGDDGTYMLPVEW